MQGKIKGEPFVVAQLKQAERTCPRAKQANLFGLNEHNPVVSIRLREDEQSGIVGVSLDVSSEHVRKIQTGIVMRTPEDFYDQWHKLILHVHMNPRTEGAPVVDPPGFVEGSLDGQWFTRPAYGLKDGAGKGDIDQPFGYSGLTGCTYFKFGIYRDPGTETWTADVSRFRRGSTIEAVQ